MTLTVREILEQLQSDAETRGLLDARVNDLKVHWRGGPLPAVFELVAEGAVSE